MTVADDDQQGPACPGKLKHADVLTCHDCFAVLQLAANSQRGAPSPPDPKAFFPQTQRRFSPAVRILLQVVALAMAFQFLVYVPRKPIRARVFADHASPGTQTNIPPQLFCMSWCPDFEFRGNIHPCAGPDVSGLRFAMVHAGT